VCTEDAPLINDIHVHDFPVRAPVAYTRGAGREVPTYFWQSLNHLHRDLRLTLLPRMTVQEHRDGFPVDITFRALTLELQDERWVLEECETSPGLSRSW
jgi:hypothetical protein